MSVAEMREAVIQKVSALQTTQALQEILEQLDNMLASEKVSEKEKAAILFDKAVKQFGNTLQRLAE